MSDQASISVKEFVDRVLEARSREQVAERAREWVAGLSEAAGSATHRAAEAWRESAPLRDEASRNAAQAGRDAARWSRRTWQRDMAPAFKRFVESRAGLIGAAGAIAPALVERRRETRHWGSFFLGLVLGAAGGVLAALLTAPKAGRQMRDELTMGAREAAGRAREAAVQAREAAANVGDWMPIFQRSTPAETTPEPSPDEGISSSPSRGNKHKATSEPAEAGE